MSRIWLLIITILLTVSVAIYLSSKAYYPPLPVSSVTSKKVISILNSSSEKMIKIAEERGYEWYITKMEQGKAYENLKDLMEDEGWQFTEQMGAGFFFQKDGQRLIVSTQMWTGNYVICQMPKGWRK